MSRNLGKRFVSRPVIAKSDSDAAIHFYEWIASPCGVRNDGTFCLYPYFREWFSIFTFFIRVLSSSIRVHPCLIFFARRQLFIVDN